jgi:hypothetical protein
MRNEKRKRKNEKGSAAKVLRRFSFCVFPFSLVAISGCARDAKVPTTRPSGVKDRQDAALRDPMGYSPNMNSPDTDISGGDIHELNRGAMKKDIDHVFNP